MSTSSLIRSPYIAQITDWTSGIAIERLRPIFYNGVLYRCITAHTTGVSFDASKFETMSGIEEAPVDTKQYVREDGAWSEIVIPTPDVQEAPSDTNQYTRGQGQWNILDAVPEAPVDGKQYARKDAGWEEVAGGGIGGITTELSASATLVVNSVNAVVSTGDKTFVVPTGSAGDTIKVLRNNFGGFNVFTGAFTGGETAIVVSDATYSLTLSWLASGSYWLYERN